VTASSAGPPAEPCPPRPAGRLARPLLVAGGLVSVAVGVVGIALPVLPTTPFLLLAAWCFARSSERLHRWLVTHRRLGVYVVGFVYGGGIPRRAKITALVVLWVSVSVSGVVVAWRLDGPLPSLALVAFLVVMAAGVSAYILTRPTGGEAAGPDAGALAPWDESAGDGGLPPDEADARRHSVAGADRQVAGGPAGREERTPEAATEGPPVKGSGQASRET